MTIQQRIDEIIRQADFDDDHEEFNACFEEMRVATGPHESMHLEEHCHEQRFVCTFCGAVNHGDPAEACGECGLVEGDDVIVSGPSSRVPLSGLVGQLSLMLHSMRNW